MRRNVFKSSMLTPARGHMCDERDCDANKATGCRDAKAQRCVPPASLIVDVHGRMFNA
jgi:hypothetical protein